MKKIVFIFILSIQFSVFAQKKSSVDSLFNLLSTEIEDTSRVKILNELAVLHFNINTDSSVYFAKKAISFSKKTKYPKGKMHAFSILGRAYAYVANFDSALFYLQLSLSEYSRNEDKKGIITVKTRMALVFMMQSKYDIALDYFFKALKLAEETNNLEKKRSILNNISVLYLDIGKFEKSYKYITEALKISIKLEDEYGEASAYANIALFYAKKKEHKRALDYHKKALLLFMDLNLNEEIAQVYLAIGETYYSIDKYQRALDNSKIALEYLENIGKTESVSILYKNMGMASIKLKNYKNARKYLLEALKFDKNSNAENTKLQIYLYLAKLDSTQGKYKNAMLYYQKYEQVKDSIYILQKEKQISEVQVKYDTQKKETENNTLKEKQKLDTERIDKQHFINVVLITLSFFFIVLIVIFKRVYSKAKNNNTLLNTKNFIIKNKNNELRTQKQEIENQKNNLEWHIQKLVEHEDLRTDSIKYALKIQMAVLPDRHLMDLLFKEYFIFLKPLQIVSGDFYWLKKIDNNLIFTIADCTGHGVPGGFLSMLGISTLNEIVNKHESLKASDILERLRETFKKSLVQTYDENKTYDGMDISLCVYNTETKILQFSGAYRPLYLITKNINSEKIDEFKNNSNCHINTSNSHTLIEIKPDKQPIGPFFKEKPFTNHKIRIQKEDVIYLFSDGYTDQLDHEKDKKYTSKRFKNLLLSIQEMSMPSQKKMIKNTFEKWIGSTKQTDDILIGGVKF